MKNNSRKAFNFYLSYFDVYQELSDKDKLIFIDALLNRQFYGVDPTDLKGMVKFAYLSQKHSIDKQIEGFENKTKTKLTHPKQGGSVGGSVGGRQGGSVQEKEKGKEKEQYVKEGINEFWDLYHSISKKLKSDLQPSIKHWNKLTETEKEKAKSNIQSYVDSVNDPKYIVKARTYLSDKKFNDEFNPPIPKKMTKERWDTMNEAERVTYFKNSLKNG